MSVYRDMMKKIDEHPQESGDAATAQPAPALISLPGLDGMRADLESLCSQFEHLTDRMRSISFCGVDMGVGVSSVALTVALQMAELHPGKVIFLDVNSRSQRASLIEAHSAPNSFLEFHNSGEMAGISTNNSLHFLSARSDRRSLGRIKAADLAQSFARLNEHYRWIIVDTPPAAHPESLLWTTTTDATVLVVESNRTRRQAALAVVEQLQSLNVNLIGSVLNRRHRDIPEWVYQLLFK